MEALLLTVIFVIIKHASCMQIISNETSLLYDELDCIDNEVRRLNVILNELLWNKTKILRRLKDIAKSSMMIQNHPTPIPTLNPSQPPTKIPTFVPTNRPTKRPTTANPTSFTSQSPSPSPTLDLNPIRENIQKSKSRKNARTKKKSVIADNQLLNAAIDSRKITYNVVRLYACELSKDWNEDVVMSLFEEQVLMFNDENNTPQNNLVIIGDARYHDITKLPNNTFAAGHTTDVFLTRFIDSLMNRILARKIPADKLKEYVIKSIERLLVIDLTSSMIKRILARMNLLSPSMDLIIFESYIAFHCGCIDYNYVGIAPLDFNASVVYDHMLYFLQYVFEEVVSLRISHSLDSLNETEYGKNNKVPVKYKEDLQRWKETKSIENTVAYFFESARLDDAGKMFISSVQLRKALHLLQLNVLSFSISHIIYEWMENKQNHRVIGISDGIICNNRMIDDFLYNLGYNDSQIERYKVKPIGKGNKFVTNPFDIPPASFDQHVVKIKMYKDGSSFLFERQLLEANDEKNDLVIILAPNVLKEAKIKSGRYSMMSDFDIECAEIMATFVDFLQLANRRQFGDEGKVLVRSLISIIVYSLTNLDENFFISSLFELDVTNPHIKECEEFSKIARIGYKMMNQSKKFIDLKMIQIKTMSAASLDVMLSFVEIVIKQLYIVNIKSVIDSKKNTSFDESNSGPMRQLFINWNTLKSSMKSDLMKFEKFMNGFKRDCIGRANRQQRKTHNIKPEIIEKINELRVTKWLIGMCNILYEWKHESDQLVVFIAYDEMWQNFFDEHNLFEFLHFIGYKNVGTNEERLSSVNDL